MVKMSEKSKEFLTAHIPAALRDEKLNDVLDKIDDLIDDKGFAPPDYHDYNDFGREAQRVRDDIYLSNT